MLAQQKSVTRACHVNAAVRPGAASFIHCSGSVVMWT